MSEQATQEEIDRFMSYVDKLPCGCWFWTGGRSRGRGRKWYGSFWFRGKTIRAHRFACDFLGQFEPMPAGQHRDHTCVFSMCVNPEHLEVVSPKVNQERKAERVPELCLALKALGLWPYDEPDYSELAAVPTACYGLTEC